MDGCHLFLDVSIIYLSECISEHNIYLYFTNHLTGEHFTFVETVDFAISSRFVSDKEDLYRSMGMSLLCFWRLRM